MKGFEFPYKGKTVFVVTDKKKKTKSLARKILNKMLLPDGRADDLLYWLNPAELTENGDTYSLKGKGFGEVGHKNDLVVITL